MLCALMPAALALFLAVSLWSDIRAQKRRQREREAVLRAVDAIISHAPWLP